MNTDEIFYRVYKNGMNFMTPTLISRGRINSRFVYEISKGKGMDREPIFGITILGVNSKGEVFKADKLNTLKYSLSQAKGYIAGLKDKMRKR